MITWICVSFIIGTFIGANIGLLTMALCVSAGNADAQLEAMRR
jgi:hypothetical protein